jgi:hypothetical protein
MTFMLNFSYALPKDKIETLVPGATTEIIATTVKDWRANKPSQVPVTSLFIWDEMVNHKKVREPFKIAPYANNHNHKGGIYAFVQKELGAAPVTAAYTVAMYRPGETVSFTDMSLVRCYPNDIHICDIEFSDYSKPLGPNDPTVEYRGWHGLHVFPEFIARLIEVAKSQEVERLSLMVAHPPLLKTFQKYGFEVSQTQIAQQAFALGQGFPMILKV